jgi:hypothetical protein
VPYNSLPLTWQHPDKCAEAHPPSRRPRKPPVQRAEYVEIPRAVDRVASDGDALRFPQLDGDAAVIRMVAAIALEADAVKRLATDEA